MFAFENESSALAGPQFQEELRGLMRHALEDVLHNDMRRLLRDLMSQLVREILDRELRTVSSISFADGSGSPSRLIASASQAAAEALKALERGKRNG